MSLVALEYQVASPTVYALGRKPATNVFRPLSKEHPEDETFPGLLLLRLEGRVFFANAELVGQKMRLLAEQWHPKVVAIDFTNVPDLEYTALKMLTEGEKKQRERGVSVWLVDLNPKVLAMVRRSPLARALGHDALQTDETERSGCHQELVFLWDEMPSFQWSLVIVSVLVLALG